MKSTKYYRGQALDTSHFNYIKTTEKNKIQPFEPKNKKQLLCKISFEIDGEQEELLIYQNVTLDQITDQLIQKIMNNDQEEDSVQEKVSLEQRKALKDQIKSKIQMTMECSIDKNAKTQKWKKKLRQIIQQKTMTPIESLSEYGTKRCLERNNTTSIKYFNYKFFNYQNQKEMSSLDLNGQQRSIEIINRAKQIQNLLSNKIEKREINQHSNRLYQLSKRNETIRSEVMRIREESEERQMFSECTFHPNVHKLQFNQHKPTKSRDNSQSKSVFKRLYKGALEKQQMSKIIEKQINEKHQQQLKKYNFIPKINQCSNEIATLKKKIHQKHGLSIYQSLYQEGNKKTKEPERNKNLTFHPKLCQKSEKIIQKSRSSKTMLKNLFSPKENSILKTQACVEDQKPTFNYYQKFRCNKQNRKKNTQRFIKNKQNIIQDSSFFEMHKSKNVSSFNNSKNFINKDHFQTNSSVLSFSTNSKTTRQKESKFNTLINQTNSKQKVVQQSFTDNKKRNGQLSGNLEYLLNSRQHSLRELDLNRSKNEDKEQKRRQRLNPFQFFKLADDKKQKKNNNKKTVCQQYLQPKKLPFNQRSKQAKNKVFSNIFKQLNSINGEEIYYESIYKCQGIPIHLKKVLYPMAQQMQQLNVGLDEQEFIWSLARICQNLPQKDQGQMMEWGEHLDFENNIVT